jgi:glycosyltransferase involved in cell wall biosynthesis
LRVGGLRIAVFLFAPTRGGAPRRALTLAQAFAERGHAVDLVLVRGEGPLRGHISPRLRVVELGVQTGGRRLATARSARPLARYLRHAQPEVLLAASNSVHLAALRAKRRAGVDTGVVLRACSHLSSSALGARRRPPHPLRLLSARWRYAEANALIAVSDDVADDLARVTGIARTRIHSVPNPVVPADVERLAAAPIDHPWFAAGEPPLVLGAGRLSAQKDFATLLRAFARLRARRPARLVILGEANGPGLRRELLALAERLGVAADVALPGMVDNPFAYMARAAVFALSSAWEGLPGVLIEAMATGCPVVSTDCPGGSAQILEGGALGPLVPVGDAAALGLALERVLDAPPERARLRRRAAAFGVDASVERYLAILRAAAPAAGRAAPTSQLALAGGPSLP